MRHANYFERLAPWPTVALAMVACAVPAKAPVPQEVHVVKQADPPPTTSHGPAEGAGQMVIRVVIHVKPETRGDFVEYLARESEQVRQMPGCERYELFESSSAANTFLLYEEWATPDDFERYKGSDLLARSFQVLGPMMAGPPDSAYYLAHAVL